MAYYYQNKENGNLLTYDEMLEEGEEIYDMTDPTNMMMWSEYYIQTDIPIQQKEYQPFGTVPQLDKYVISGNPDERRYAAEQGYGLEILVNDKDKYVRAEVASRRYGLEQLINDPDPFVRIMVAKEQYGLDVLVNDPNGFVKCEIARICSTNDNILEILSRDKDWLVREAVAEIGYGLDTLVNDSHRCVREAVAQNCNGNKDILDRLINDEYESVRVAVAEQGYGLERLIDDESILVRIAVANQGYGLEMLSQDPEALVREAVVHQANNELLETMSYDKDWIVRAAVAERGYALDRFISDPDMRIRCRVAEQGYGLDRLINDDSSYVREIVAKQGYGLDMLQNDESQRVTKAVKNYKIDNGYPVTLSDSSANVLNNYIKSLSDYAQCSKSIPNYLENNELKKIVRIAESEGWEVSVTQPYLKSDPNDTRTIMGFTHKETNLYIDTLLLNTNNKNDVIHSLIENISMEANKYAYSSEDIRDASESLARNLQYGEKTGFSHIPDVKKEKFVKSVERE